MVIRKLSILIISYRKLDTFIYLNNFISIINNILVVKKNFSNTFMKYKRSLCSSFSPFIVLRVYLYLFITAFWLVLHTTWGSVIMYFASSKQKLVKYLHKSRSSTTPSFGPPTAASRQITSYAFLLFINSMLVSQTASGLKCFNCLSLSLFI